MKQITNKGFIGIGTIISVILAVVVLGGITYYATNTKTPSLEEQEMFEEEEMTEETAEIQTGQVPIASNSQGQQLQLDTYFANIHFNANATNCSTTYATVRSVPQTNTVVRAAIQAVLDGPTTNEYNAGYRTALRDGLAINTLSVANNGTAYLDLTSSAPNAPNMGMGACGTGLAVSQLENTLLQFPTVSTTVITFNGVPIEDTLDP